MRMRSSIGRMSARRAPNVLCVAAVIVPALLVPGPADAGIEASRQAELLYLLKHDCGSCHGMTRKGGLGSPLRSEDLAGMSDETLVAIILDGMEGTPMPPWRPLLNPGEAEWLVRALRNGAGAK